MKFAFFFESTDVSISNQRSREVQGMKKGEFYISSWKAVRMGWRFGYVKLQKPKR